MIPILNPAGVQEILDYGLYGFALSRFAGTWVGAEMRQGQHRIDGNRWMAFGLDRLNIVFPDRFDMPPGGLNIRPGELDMLGPGSPAA